MRDNSDSWNKVLFPERYEQKTAKRTADEIESIRTRWSNRKVNQLWEYMANGILPIGYKDLILEMENDITFGNFDVFNKKYSQLYNLATKQMRAVDIQSRWRQRIINNLSLEYNRYGIDDPFMEASLKLMKQARLDNDSESFVFNYNEAKLILAQLQKSNTSALVFSSEQLKRFAEMEQYFGIKRGIPMVLAEADRQSANPLRWSGDEAHKINCQTCAPAYVLRSQGFNICAKGRTKNSGQPNDWIAFGHSFDIWENIDGTNAEPNRMTDWMTKKGYARMSAKRYKEFYEENTKEVGIYITSIGWKGNNGGHATILQRFADGTLAYIEPQEYFGLMKRDIMEICKDGEQIPYFTRGIMRVDNKLLKHFCTDGSGNKIDIWSIFNI